MPEAMGGRENRVPANQIVPAHGERPRVQHGEQRPRTSWT